MTSEKRVRNSFHEQANYCEKLGSTFMRDLLQGLGEALDKSTETGKQVLEWPGEPEPKSDALALRLAGGLHALARSDVDNVLSEFYSTPERSAEPGFIPSVLAAIENHDAELDPWLDFAPQTNEVARASVIFAGLSVVADRFKLPLELYELGCSGGLNLQCSQFGYRFAGEQFGVPKSSLKLEPDWEGRLPPSVEPNVVSRMGCDLNPLSVNNSDHEVKLVSYLWPDQPARIARVEAAIAIAKADPPHLEKANAADWVERKLVAGEGMGLVRVLYDTIAWNYFPYAEKERISEHIHRVGAQATKENPLCWLTFEFDGDNNGPFLKLRTWPEEGDEEILASADPHVCAVKWRAVEIK